MKKLLLAALLGLLPALSMAQVKINALPSASSVAGTDLAIADQSGTTRTATYGQVLTYVNANASIPLTGLPSITSQAVLCNGSGSSATPTACVLGGNLVATTTTLVTSQAINSQTGTSYALVTGDAGKLITFNNASATAVTLSVATTTGFTAGYSFDVHNIGAGVVTITPTTSTINGATTLVIPKNRDCTVTSDGTNYQVSACTATLSQQSYVISGLPSCTSALQGLTAYVTNAQTSPTYLGSVSTTGAVVAPVFCNGSGWVYH